MAVVKSLDFRDWGGQLRTIQLAPTDELTSTPTYHVSTVTGKNGSYKSTFLKELVSALVLKGGGSRAQFIGASGHDAHVVCMSGSVADRYPSKELSGGGSSEYDLPNYAYLGQRVGTNLLSKKRPLETLLSFALDESRYHRYSWDFYAHAHWLVGIKPNVRYQLAPKRRGRNGEKIDVLGKVQALANGSAGRRNGSHPKLSRSTAAWLLDEFDYDDFTSLQRLLAGNSKLIRIELGADGPTVLSGLDIAPIRLGILTDLLSVTEVEVTSRTTGKYFSAYDLSSGEYHMFCSLLGLGFGVRDESIVLIDEPENSLHPQWQQDFMEAVIGIGNDVLNFGHIIICTHSPLIVAATPERATVVDLGSEFPNGEPSSYGASCDEILLSQFGIASGRNRVVAERVQRAVSLVERGDFGNPEFKSMKGMLASTRKALRSDDPLAQVIDALLEDEGE